MSTQLLYSQAIDLLKQLISIPSFSKEENKTAEAIKVFLNTKRIVTEQHGNNIWAKNKFFDESKPTMLLNSH